MRISVRSFTPENFFWGTLLVGACFFLTGAVYPLDDFYRHLVASYFDYNPLKNYPDSEVTAYSQYYLFEKILALVAHKIGFIWTMFLGEALSFVLTYSIFYSIVKNWDLEKQKLVASQVALLFVAAVSSRMVLLRPEYFVFLNLLLFFTQKNVLKNWGWVFIPFSILSYWLVPMWAFLLIAHYDKLHRKILAFVGILIVHTLVWQILSNGDWISSISRWHQFGANRVESIVELSNFWKSSFLSPWFWILCFFATAGFSRNILKNNAIIPFVAYNILGYARLVGAFLVCLFPLIKEGVKKHEKMFTTYPWVSYAFCVSLVVSGFTPVDVPLFKLPPNSKVLTENVATYTLNYANPGTIQIVPSFDVGASPKEIQTMVKNLPSMNISCDALNKWKITHIVEKSARKPAPACLTLSATYGPWRLWTISTTHN